MTDEPRRFLRPSLWISAILFLGLLAAAIIATEPSNKSEMLNSPAIGGLLELEERLLSSTEPENASVSEAIDEPESDESTELNDESLTEVVDDTIADASEGEAEPSKPSDQASPLTADDPADSESTNWWVQLGAYASQDQARGRWQRLLQVYQILLSEQTYRIKEIHGAGGALTSRLNGGGFRNKAVAVKLCLGLQQAGGECFVLLDD